MVSPKKEKLPVQGDLYSSIMPLMKAGKILGLIPLTGVWSKGANVDPDRLQFRWESFGTKFSAAILLMILAKATVGILSLVVSIAKAGDGIAFELAVAARTPFFHLAVLAIYIYFMRRTKQLLKLFKTWKHISSKLTLTQCDTQLSRDIKMFSFAILAKTLFIFLATHLNELRVFRHQILQSGSNTTRISTLETYFNRAQKEWTYFVSYHPALAIFLMISDGFSYSVWNYADLFIIVLARALYFKFKALKEETEKRMVRLSDDEGYCGLQDITWKEVRRNHFTLCSLLDQFSNFLSRLIFLSYALNIFLICLLVHQGLTTPATERNYFNSVGGFAAFFQLIFRMMAISLVGSKVNEYAHGISVSIQKCSSKNYCNEAERLERMIGTCDLGLNGMGCFVITRAFILVVLSVIFTTEIILLQTYIPGLTKATSGGPIEIFSTTSVPST